MVGRGRRDNPLSAFYFFKPASHPSQNTANLPTDQLPFNKTDESLRCVLGFPHPFSITLLVVLG